MIEVNEWAERVTALIEGQLKLWAGLVINVTAALLASSDLLPDGKAKHALQVAFIVSTAVNAYFIQHPKKEQ